MRLPSADASLVAIVTVVLITAETPPAPVELEATA